MIERILRELKRSSIAASKSPAQRDGDEMDVEEDFVVAKDEVQAERGIWDSAAVSSANHDRMQLRSQSSGNGEKEEEVMESVDESGTGDQDVPTTDATIMEGTVLPRKYIDVLGISERDKGSIVGSKMRMNKLNDIEAKRRKTHI